MSAENEARRLKVDGSWIVLEVAGKRYLGPPFAQAQVPGADPRWELLTVHANVPELVALEPCYELAPQSGVPQSGQAAIGTQPLSYLLLGHSCRAVWRWDGYTRLSTMHEHDVENLRDFVKAAESVKLQVRAARSRVALA